MWQFSNLRNIQKKKKKSKEILITGVNNKNLNKNNLRTKNKTTKSRKRKWEEKQLYGYFKQQLKKLHTRWPGDG